MAYQEVFIALADPTRRVIFERLRGGAQSVGELASGLPVSRPAVSQHLRVLREARLVRERAEGTRRFYSIDPTGLAALRSYVESFWADVLAAYQAAANEREGEGQERAAESAGARGRESVLDEALDLIRRDALLGHRVAVADGHGIVLQ